jgi:hypothetical protein
MNTPACIVDVGYAPRISVIQKLVRMPCPLMPGARIQALKYTTLKGHQRALPVSSLSASEHQRLMQWLESAPRTCVADTSAPQVLPLTELPDACA